MQAVKSRSTLVNTLDLLDLDSERQLLHLAMNNADVAAELEGRSDLFVSLFHQKVLCIVQGLVKENKPCTPVAVLTELKDIGSLGETERKLFFDDFFLNTKADMDYLTARLEKLARLRSLKDGLGSTIEQIQGDLDPDQVISQVLETLEKVDSWQKEVLSVEEQTDKFLAIFDELMERKGQHLIKTCFPKLNQHLGGGFEQGELVIVSAPTGVGKTSFSMNLASHFAVSQRIPTLYINTEMTEKQMACKIGSMLADSKSITFEKIRNGFLTADDVNRLFQALDRYHKGRLFLQHGSKTVKEVVASARRLRRSKGLQVVFIDYIGRLMFSGKGDTWEKMIEAAKQFKTMAVDLNLLVFLIAQADKESGELKASKGMANEADIWANLRKLKESEIQSLPGCNRLLEFSKGRVIAGEKKLKFWFDGARNIFVEV